MQDNNIDNKCNLDRTEWSNNSDHIFGEISDSASSLFRATIAHGGRVVLCGDNAFLIFDDKVADADDADEAGTLLNQHGYECLWLPYWTMIWGNVRFVLEYTAMQVRDLVMEAGLDPAIWYPEWKSVDQAKELIVRLNREYGRDFFQLKPDDRRAYEVYLPPFVPAGTHDRANTQAP